MHASIGSSHSPRFNPFDDLSTSTELDDDTFAPSSVSEITSTASEGSGDISLAELGLTEDYFAHPEGLFGMSSTEELEAAIENCKKMILETREHSERQKKLVNKLIQLRMKFLELKEGPAEVELKVKQVLGHKLRKKKSNRIKYYCDCCSGLIWGMLQAWYRCKECGFNCHYKCVNTIRRKCIADDLINMPYILNIVPEAGLSAQQFNCIECKNPISVTGDGKEEARLCDYSGQYFCPQCHWNDTSIMPGRVLHNWDFTPQKVSRQSFQILSRLYRKPLLNVQEVNPLLFNYVEELGDIRKLREDILLMKEYFITCNSALDLKLLLKLHSRQHFVDGANMYSMEDLVLAQDRVLSDELTKLHTEYAQHIKLDCLYCQAKGFICEICNLGETLFPFDFGVSTCSKCKAVFHRDCFTFSDCPRCKRLQRKREQKAAIIAQKLTPESDENESEIKYFRDKKSSSSDLSSSQTDDNTALITEFTPAFSAEPHEMVHSLTKERTPSSTIEIINSTNNPRDTSLHNLLTDSSYTDYCLLGFTGAGKGRQSVPNLQQPFMMAPPMVKESQKPINREAVVVSTKPSRDNSGFERKQKTRIRFEHSQDQRERYENNPITRRRQRDETLFSDLIKVKGHVQSEETTKGHRRGSKEDQSGVKVAGAQSSRSAQGRASKVDLEDPFNCKETKGTKFMKEAAKVNSRASKDLTSDPGLGPFNRNQKRGSKLTTGTARVQPTRVKEQPGPMYDAKLDPFGQNQSMGSKFIEDSTRINSRSKRRVETTSRSNHNLDPFTTKRGAKPSKQSTTPESSYDPNLDPFNQNEPRGSKFIDDSTRINSRSKRRVETTSSSNHNLDPFTTKRGARPSKQSTAPESSYNPNLDPFNQSESRGSKFIDDSTRINSRSKRRVETTPSSNHNLDPFTTKRGARPSKQSTAPESSYNPNLDPFNQNEPKGSKVIYDSISSEVTSSRNHGENPIEDGSSGNPFNDDYDDDKNPFS